jgi:hypothetical protein
MSSRASLIFPTAALGDAAAFRPRRLLPPQLRVAERFQCSDGSSDGPRLAGACAFGPQSRLSGCRHTPHDRFDRTAASRRAIALATKQWPGPAPRAGELLRWPGVPPMFAFRDSGRQRTRDRRSRLSNRARITPPRRPTSRRRASRSATSPVGTNHGGSESRSQPNLAPMSRVGRYLGVSGRVDGSGGMTAERR